MSVAVSPKIVVHPFRQRDELDPIGWFVAYGTVTGDASLGYARAIISAPGFEGFMMLTHASVFCQDVNTVFNPSAAGGARGLLIQIAHAPPVTYQFYAAEGFSDGLHSAAHYDPANPFIMRIAPADTEPLQLSVPNITGTTNYFTAWGFLYSLDTVHRGFPRRPALDFPLIIP